ncbi:MAG: membrane protein insertion efficiency factor YidD [Clostridia bacterium]|nr:membrane protein insertion efficiency factor YidD [Clostridia bacterium]
MQVNASCFSPDSQQRKGHHKQICDQYATNCIKQRLVWQAATFLIIRIASCHGFFRHLFLCL